MLILGCIGNVLRKLNMNTCLSSINMEILCIENFYSNEKSVNELGMQYRTTDMAITDAVNYFKAPKSQVGRY